MKANITIKIILAVNLLMLSFSVRAIENNLAQHIQQLKKDAETQKLYQDKAWLSLLHYREGLRGFKSEADDANFFLSANGHVDPKTELLVSIEQFYSEIVLNDKGSDKQHPLCRFPARFNWLNSQLDFREDLLPKTQCKEFWSWQKQFKAHSLTLVFPAAYINSPSSMFGHTFIRVDPISLNERNRLHSISVNYSAAAGPNDGQFKLIYKGLLGGFKGTTETLPYHLKVKQYSDLESRDIWEYHLNFTPEEAEQFVRHIWEVGFVNFNYLYIDENCAYRILTLLEAVRPMGTLEQFTYQVIPANTIQALEKAEAIKAKTFRPSISSQLNHYIASLDEDSAQWVRDIINEKIELKTLTESDLDPVKKAAILESAYEALRYRGSARRIDKDLAAKKSFPLLIARSKIKEKANFPEQITPKTHSAGGHGSSKLALGIGADHLAKPSGSNIDNNRDYLKLQIRPSYHELTDPPDGFTLGAQIEFLKTDFKLYEDNILKLDQLQLVSVQSLAPKEIYITPKSWVARAGLKRLNTLTDDFNVAYIEGGIGRTQRVAGGLIFALLVGEVQADQKLGDGFAAGPGIKSGYLRHSGFGQSLLSLDLNRFFSENHYQSGSLELEHVWNLRKNQALAFNIKRVKNDTFYLSNAELNFRYFY